MNDKSTFKIKKIYNNEDIIGKTIEYEPDDNLDSGFDKTIITEHDKAKFDVGPGNYKLCDQFHKVYLSPIEYKTKSLEPIEGTKLVKQQIALFLKNFDIYYKRGLVPKRSILLYSTPGQGKTSSITQAVQDHMDDGTLVLNWTCGNPSESEVFEWFSSKVSFASDVKKLIFIIEDLGGTWESNYVNLTSLLNLLDGSMNIFKVPTMIIATTNHPEKLVAAVGNRPGRFDKIEKFPDLSDQDRINLCNFYCNNVMVADTKIAGSRKYKSLSAAHIEEAVNRALLESLTLEQGLDAMVNFDKQFEKNFSEKKRIGIDND